MPRVQISPAICKYNNKPRIKLVKYIKSEGAITNISPAAFRITTAVMIIECSIKRFLMPDIAPKMSAVRTII
jgi:hypothetical protein